MLDDNALGEKLGLLIYNMDELVVPLDHYLLYVPT